MIFSELTLVSFLKNMIIGLLLGTSQHLIYSMPRKYIIIDYSLFLLMLILHNNYYSILYTTHHYTILHILLLLTCIRFIVATLCYVFNLKFRFQLRKN